MTDDADQTLVHRRGRVARTRMRGVVALEFIVAFPAVMLFLLGVFQIMHGQVARLMVSQASHRAARAASLWITECELGTFAAGAICTGGAAAGPAPFAGGNEIEDRIRAAAALVLAPLAPPIGNNTPVSRAGDAPAHVMAMAGLGARAELDAWRERHHWSADRAYDTDVSLDGRGVSKLITAYDTTRVVYYGHDDATGRARVVIEHAYSCGFPLASLFYCHAFESLPPGWRAHLSNRGLPQSGRYRIMRAPATHAMAPLPED